MPTYVSFTFSLNPSLGPINRRGTSSIFKAGTHTGQEYALEYKVDRATVKFHLNISAKATGSQFSNLIFYSNRMKNCLKHL